MEMIIIIVLKFSSDRICINLDDDYGASSSRRDEFPTFSSTDTHTGGKQAAAAASHFSQPTMELKAVWPPGRGCRFATNRKTVFTRPAYPRRG